MLALLDTGFSNLKAYSNVLTYLEQEYEVVDNGDGLNLNHHTCLLLPGVSNFGSLASELKKRNFETKIKSFVDNGKKVIGTCSGMQIFFSFSEESQSTCGLGLIQGEVKKFPTVDKIDINVGWRKTKLGDYFFVHGFYCVENITLDKVTYSKFNGKRFISEFQHKNVYGFQYHPEKSGINGIHRLNNILKNSA
jgi:imidazole glycerol phosphate synthase glutamine amidotransferase subunit